MGKIMYIRPLQPSLPVITGAMNPACDAWRVWPLLNGLEETYPGFGEWFTKKVIPGCIDQTRRVFLAASVERVHGVVIAKRTAAENKICTVWIAPHARGCGVARSLMLGAIEWIGTSTPLFTVPEERMGEFVSLTTQFGFQLTAELPSYYREGRSEFVFNGQLKSPLHS